MVVSHIILLIEIYNGFYVGTVNPWVENNYGGYQNRCNTVYKEIFFIVFAAGNYYVKCVLLLSDNTDVELIFILCVQTLPKEI